MREKCYKCMRPDSQCLCGEIFPIETSTLFVILIHTHEFKKVKNNTGRMTHLSLKNSEMHMGVSFAEHKRVNELIKNTNCYVLYPGKSAIEVSDIPTKKNNTIFIIDSTWPCSKKLMRLSPNLVALPKISFNIAAKSIYEFKRQPKDYCLSTIESVKVVLEQLDTSNLESIDKSQTQDFLNPFKKMIQTQIDFRNDPNITGYRRGKS